MKRAAWRKGGPFWHTPPMDSLESRMIRLLADIHPLDRIPRAGYVLRGVPEPESVAAHSHFVALLTLLVCDACPGQFDRDKALTMAIMHDLAEARLMDIPMPVGDAYLKDAKRDAEQAIFDDLLAGFPARYAEYHRELLDAASPEARLIRGLDKAQMMIKIVMYQKEGRGRLDEFWNNPRNFADFGIEPVARLFDAICAHAGKTRPG
ncbi:MAG TPA: HD family hydrolase [Candidatus Hydrogenedentes bacterium]|nr:HD family hydrolase [Candidatus Hydrogenedentota bacterium]HQH69230.1 HD family hydrolase [Candidatus Hydrogenedentota bacterium]HQK76771.1 HD family hydrolase [Candidatus Hydrogenedentota bacterium]